MSRNAPKRDIDNKSKRKRFFFSHFENAFDMGREVPGTISLRYFLWQLVYVFFFSKLPMSRNAEKRKMEGENDVFRFFIVLIFQELNSSNTHRARGGINKHPEAAGY
jgi:hypothetical protein